MPAPEMLSQHSQANEEACSLAGRRPGHPSTNHQTAHPSALENTIQFVKWLHYRLGGNRQGIRTCFLSVLSEFGRIIPNPKRPGAVVRIMLRKGHER